MQNPRNSDDHGPRRCSTESTSPVSDLRELALEICRGKTQFPLRPITGERCLIGAGDKCDVRLGGSEIPLLHSLLYQDGTDIWLEAIAPSPKLLVNGKPHDDGPISVGDQISIDCFEFIVRQADSQAAQPMVDCSERRKRRSAPKVRISVKNNHALRALIRPNNDQIELDVTELESLDISDLSASELVDLIEQEEKLIEEFEAKRVAGAEALLQTIKTRMDSIARVAMPDSDRLAVGTDENESQLDETTPTLSLNSIAEGERQTTSESSMLHQIEEVLEELDLFSESLQKRSDSLLQRESTFAEATAALLDLQNKMATQMETLTNRLSSLPDERQTQSRRIA